MIVSQGVGTADSPRAHGMNPFALGNNSPEEKEKLQGIL
jgi:hypothetical protein